tara:strand:- start:2212 stop:3216 length:1005 start_codon:yes stop_codon:yes gene_type:complete
MKYIINLKLIRSLNLFGEIYCPIDSTKFKLLEGQGKYPRKRWVSIDKRKPDINLIKTKIVKIEETPHYKLLDSEENSYKEYFNKNKWTNYGVEHSYDNFKKLIKNFDIEKVEITCKDVKGKLVIRDGLHRMSILTYNYDKYKDKNVTIYLPDELTIAQLLTNNKCKWFNNFDQYKDKKLTFFKNKEHEMNVRIQNLKDVINTFNECEVFYWLQGKTLLGMVRDNKLIENDHDEDIGTMCENINNVCCKIIPILKNKGFEVVRATANNSMVSVIRNYRYIDICFFINKKNTIGYEKKFFPKEYYDSFSELNINNFKYNIPLKCKDIIKHSYNIKL